MSLVTIRGCEVSGVRHKSVLLLPTLLSGGVKPKEIAAPVKISGTRENRGTANLECPVSAVGRAYRNP